MQTLILDNDIENIKLFDEAGVDIIFVDLEVLGKEERQGHVDTVKNFHTLDDVKRIRPILKNAQLLVRINPIHEHSHYEIDTAIQNGADIVMLPMFKTVEEVRFFIQAVNRRARVCLLLETSEALARLDDILEIEGIDVMHIGLNDLHLALGLNFLFELLGDGLMEYITGKIKAKGIPFGIGGVARMDEGMLKGESIIKEHVRLGSERVILSRAFRQGLPFEVAAIRTELDKLHQVVAQAQHLSTEALLENKRHLKETAIEIGKKIKAKTRV